MVSVIIACGGNSTRMGGTNKLLMKLDGMTVIEKTVRAFCEINNVSEIILCCCEALEKEISKTFLKNISKPVKFAPNGETRQKSVANGFEVCDKRNDLVCIHDGARPLILEETIKKSICDALKYGSSVVCVPCKHTVKISADNGSVKQTPAREKLFLTQTPQIFRTSQYQDALEFAKEKGEDFTDDSQLFEAMGIMPHITVGEYSNIKITTPEDIILANQLIKQRKD